MEVEVTVDRRIEKSSGLEKDRSHDEVTIEFYGLQATATLNLKGDAANQFKTGGRFAMVFVAKDR